MSDRSNPSPPPAAARRERPGTGPVPVQRDSLPTAVDAGLDQLRNLAVVDAVAGAGDLEQRLRTALSTDPATRGRAAAREACAHLAAGQLADAHFTLLTARDQILTAAAARRPDVNASTRQRHVTTDQ